MTQLRDKILSTIVEKSTLKQRVFDNTFAVFGMFFSSLKDGIIIESNFIQSSV